MDATSLARQLRAQLPRQVAGSPASTRTPANLAQEARQALARLKVAQRSLRAGIGP